MNIIYILII